MNQFFLRPNIGTSSIVKRNTRFAKFYCNINEEVRSCDVAIELWSDLTILKEWTNFPFLRVTKTDYIVKIDISKLPPDKYEFTLRFKALYDKQWSWYGDPGQNGQIRILEFFQGRLAPEITQKAPQFIQVFTKHNEEDSIDLYHFSAFTNQVENGSIELGPLSHKIHGYVTLLRKGLTWLTPVAGTQWFTPNANERHQVLLYQDAERGSVHLWMLFGSKADCWFSFGVENTVHIHCNQDTTIVEEGCIHLIILTAQNEVSYISLVKLATEHYYKNIEGINLEIKQATDAPENPVLLNTLGYCTWNAFGQSINDQKLTSLLKSVKKKNLPIEYIIFDDGWQSTNEKSQTLSFGLCPVKFPYDLKQAVSKVKHICPNIQYVGVWHTLWGYWKGVSSELSQKQGYCYYDLKDRDNISIGLLKQPSKFYQEFYTFLRQSGVDFVKVDNQGGFQNLLCNFKDQLKIWDTYRQALIDCSDDIFLGKVIHCMALTPYILLKPILSYKTKSLFRNSDDFFPEVVESHPWHIYANAINTLWTCQYPVIADWDMFQSSHPFAEYHASSRAISGGPVYITDPPDNHNEDLIARLVGITRGGRLTLLRCLQPPTPAFDTVFGDPIGGKDVLCLYNTNIEEADESSMYVVCGFWNTQSSTRLCVVNSKIFGSHSLFKNFAVGYVVTGIDQGKLNLIHLTKGNNNNAQAEESEECSKKDFLLSKVNGLGSSLISISCTKSFKNVSVACLGLIDKFNGTRAIVKTEIGASKLHSSNEAVYIEYQALFSHKSKSCGFWIAQILEPQESYKSRNYLAIVSISMDGSVLDKNKDWNWNEITGLLTVNMLNATLYNSSPFHFEIKIQIAVQTCSFNKSG